MFDKQAASLHVPPASAWVHCAYSSPKLGSADSADLKLHIGVSVSRNEWRPVRGVTLPSRVIAAGSYMLVVQTEMNPEVRLVFWTWWHRLPQRVHLGKTLRVWDRGAENIFEKKDENVPDVERWRYAADATVFTFPPLTLNLTLMFGSKSDQISVTRGRRGKLETFCLYSNSKVDASSLFSVDFQFCCFAWRNVLHVCWVVEA